MTKIDYENIKKIMNRRFLESICFSEIIMKENLQKEYLSKFLSKDKIDEIQIDKTFCRTEFRNVEVINYETTKINQLENGYPLLDRHLLIYNNEKENAILEIAQMKNIENNSGLVYDEWKLYDQNKKIVFLMKSCSKIVDSNLVQKQLVLTEKNCNSNDYITKHYDLSYLNNECIILGIDGSYHTLGNNSFMNRLEIVSSHIRKLESIFESYIDSSIGLEEPTKVYKIRRKR